MEQIPIPGCTILYDFLATSSGLQEWFADKVDDQDGVFTFSWDGSEDTAEMVDSEEEKFIRFHWSHAPKEEYFEFSIEKSEVTNQTILVIKDFAEKKRDQRPEHALEPPGKGSFSPLR